VTIHGDAGHDRLQGTARNDVIYGGSGNDVVQGLRGNDLLYGDAGRDSLYGSDGNDTVGGDDEDQLRLVGQGAPAAVVGHDRLDGGAGNDWLLGGSHSLLITDNNGRDTFIGGSGSDILDARGGDDVLTDRQAGDTVPSEASHGPGAHGAHIHIRLQIFIRNSRGQFQQVYIPAGVGDFAGGAIVHTHADDNIIHLHDSVARSFRLDEFFRNWGVSLDARHLGRNVAAAGRRVAMTVNGVANTQLGSYVLRDLDDIAIAVG
jgi:Ca2+-binding RTX toxin-like protein